MNSNFLDLSGPFDFDEFLNYPSEDEREDSNRLGFLFFFFADKQAQIRRENISRARYATTAGASAPSRHSIPA